MNLQKWRLTDWIILIWCAILATIALLAIYPGLEKTWCWATRNASNIASWVQAIGSIAAIWGAFRIANLQFLDARNREAHATADAAAKIAEGERQEKRRKYMLLYDRFHSCTTMVEAIDKTVFLRKVEIDIAIIAVKDLLAIIESITIEDVPDLELVVDVSHFRIRLQVLKYQLLSCAESIATENNHDKNTKFALDAVAEVVHWGKLSRSVCEERLKRTSNKEELAVALGYFASLKVAHADWVKSRKPS